MEVILTLLLTLPLLSVNRRRTATFVPERLSSAGGAVPYGMAAVAASSLYATRLCIFRMGRRAVRR
jgi:hypothetical protein